MPRARSTGTATGSCSARAPASWSWSRAEHALARGATIHAEVIGAALTADAFHISAPDPTGRGATRAMTMALRDAGIAPDEVDYIVAHGTSTPLNDVTETRAIKAAFGDHALQGGDLVAQVDGRPSAGRGGRDERPDGHRRHPTATSCRPRSTSRARPAGLRPGLHALVARQQRVDTAIINGFGFGGQNAVAVFRRFAI